MTNGEIKGLFELIDANHDNELDASEWTDFKKLFIDDFETCDADADYQLSVDELSACLELPAFDGLLIDL